MYVCVHLSTEHSVKQRVSVCEVVWVSGKIVLWCYQVGSEPCRYRTFKITYIHLHYFAKKSGSLWRLLQMYDSYSIQQHRPTHPLGPNLIRFNIRGKSCFMQLFGQHLCIFLQEANHTPCYKYDKEWHLCIFLQNANSRAIFLQEANHTPHHKYDQEWHLCIFLQIANSRAIFLQEASHTPCHKYDKDWHLCICLQNANSRAIFLQEANHTPRHK